MTHISDLFKLNGKVALVTGGGKGLGFFAAEGLAEAGANVAICGRDIHGKLDAAVKLLKKSGQDCIALKCDVTQEEEVREMAKKVQEYYGKCDILVNNAGIGDVCPSKSVKLKDWSKVINTNLTGTFLCSREIGKIMIRQKSGNIINFSSENGQVGFSLGMTAYATSKIGLIGLTRSLAVEWGKYNIRVNAILPGNMEEGMMEMMKEKNSTMFQTLGDPLLDLIPLKRFGSGDDIKGAIVFLASDASKYISGAKIVVDGGFTINAGV
ncbi:MAG: SDR family oxidoreductase [Candidatus Lokiarchaeota archaeon]|nr:SDR family oxidoreductase [Candidatus Lokiarchaeota archaeon]